MRVGNTYFPSLPNEHVSDFDPVPATDPGQRWQSGTDTFDRVYDVLLGTTQPTSSADIAERADCSPNAAKKHLDRLVEMGIARVDDGATPIRYQRDEAYLEWQEASRIARELTTEEIVDRVAELEAEREAHEERFDAEDPATVSALDGDDHRAVHERMSALGEWQAVLRDVRIYELARQLSDNDGHLISV